MSRSFKIVLLPGDGIGPEVTAEAVGVLEAVKDILGSFHFDLREYPAGAQCFHDTGVGIPADTWTACKEADAIFLGAMGLPGVLRVDGTEPAPQVTLRRDLDLYAGLRPIYLFHTEHTPLRGYRAGEIDIILLRESTEGLFASHEKGVRVGNELAVDNLVITRRGTRRLMEFACKLQRTGGRSGEITCVDKANILGSMAFFRQVCRETVTEFPEIRLSCAYVDAVAMQLVRQPRSFDMMVAENMFGDILSDLMAGLVGGMGMAPSADIGDNHAVFQPAHGSAPDISGGDTANPIAAILSAELMLEYLATKHSEKRLSEGASLIRKAVEAFFAETPKSTPDLGGTMKCSEVGAAIRDRVRAQGRK